jgi:predicted nucleic acid-binding Zn ribbon protein
MAVKLGEILPNLEGGVGRLIRGGEAVALWNRAVDERVGKNSEAIKIVNRTLHVSTASPAWAQELAFLKPEIIKKFNQLAGEELIRDIRFKAAGG